MYRVFIGTFDGENLLSSEIKLVESEKDAQLCCLSRSRDLLRNYQCDPSLIQKLDSLILQLREATTLWNLENIYSAGNSRFIINNYFPCNV